MSHPRLRMYSLGRGPSLFEKVQSLDRAILSRGGVFLFFYLLEVDHHTRCFDVFCVRVCRFRQRFTRLEPFSLSFFRFAWQVTLKS